MSVWYSKEEEKKSMENIMHIFYKIQKRIHRDETIQFIFQFLTLIALMLFPVIHYIHHKLPVIHKT